MGASGLAQRHGSRARQAWLALVLAATASLEAVPPEVRAQARRSSTAGSSATSAPAPAADGIQLRVRRLPDAVELVLVDAGLGASLTQQPLGNQWLGELRTDRARSLKVGPQSVALAADGMERISFEGSGTSFRLTVTAAAGRALPQPVVSSDGRDLVVRFPAAPNVLAQTARPNLQQPSPVPTQVFAPPLRPRAIAPPLGDMAIGTMTLKNPGFIELNGPPVTLTTRSASARDVLMVLAQMGGYGFAFAEPITIQDKRTTVGSVVGGSSARQSRQTETEERESKQGFVPPVTVSFKKESYQRAFNFVLLTAGLQAKKEGNTIIVGQDILSKTIGTKVSKVFRLNQVSPSSAADYLANLGAVVTKTNTIATSVTTGGDQNQPQGAPNNATTTSSTSTTVEAFGATAGPLVGLQATTDSRLGTITIIGDSYLINVAEQYLKQLDLRQRQVALTVRILDLSLDNNAEFSNSFAFRSGNSFILNDNGSLSAVFGNVTVTGAANPGLSYPNQQFIDQFRAQIQSSSTKVLASPTLILSEFPERLPEDTTRNAETIQSPYGVETISRPYANEAFVTIGEQLVTSFTTQSSSSGAPPVCTPVFSNSGLTFGARIKTIDDNGFVTFSLSPEISAAVGTPLAIEGCGQINTINRRRLDTGNLRVRDGQTLILTGVIGDDVIATVSKWPILGDIPLIGQFFRSSNTSRRKRELIILVTPRIINEDSGRAYGYGFIPTSDESRKLLYSQ